MVENPNDDANPEEFFFREVIAGGNEAEGWTAAMFMSKRLSDSLQGTQRLHIDATFKVLPQQLNAYQLLTVHAEHQNMLFPIAFALMTRKSQQAYVNVLQYVRDCVPNLSPQTILTDYEAAMKNAAQVVWPAAHLVGCFFHYGQAVFKMHARLGMRPFVEGNLEAEMALRMLLSLPLLPANLIPAGLQVIRHYTVAHGMQAQYIALLEYIDEYWIGTVGAGTFSVWGQHHRTNNIVENFNRQLKMIMGEHPGVWRFHMKLRALELDEWIQYLRSLNNPNITRPRVNGYNRQDANIHQAQVLLQQGRLNVAQFLSRVSFCTDNLIADLRGQRRVPRLVDVGAQRAADPVMPPHLDQQPGQLPVIDPVPPLPRRPNRGGRGRGRGRGRGQAQAAVHQDADAPAGGNRPGPVRGRRQHRQRGRYNPVAVIQVHEHDPANDPDDPLPFNLIPPHALGYPPLAPAALGEAPPPALDQGANPPAVDQAANPPAVDQAANPPAVDQAANPPAVDQGANPPAVDQAAPPEEVVVPVWAQAGVNNEGPRLEGACTICLVQPATMVAIPCGHVCTCSECAETLRQQNDNRCPYCRLDNIIGFFQLYNNL